MVEFCLYSHVDPVKGQEHRPRDLKHDQDPSETNAIELDWMDPGQNMSEILKLIWATTGNASDLILTLNWMQMRKNSPDMAVIILKQFKKKQTPQETKETSSISMSLQKAVCVADVCTFAFWPPKRIPRQCQIIGQAVNHSPNSFGNSSAQFVLHNPQPVFCYETLGLWQFLSSYLSSQMCTGSWLGSQWALQRALHYFYDEDLNHHERYMAIILEHSHLFCMFLLVIYVGIWWMRRCRRAVMENIKS